MRGSGLTARAASRGPSQRPAFPVRGGARLQLQSLRQAALQVVTWLADRCCLESTRFFSQCFLSILILSISLRAGAEALGKMETNLSLMELIFWRG